MVVVQFIGGPADGQTRAVEGDEPPRTFPVYTYCNGTFVYQRQVSQMDDGPLWVYVPMES